MYNTRRKNVLNIGENVKVHNGRNEHKLMLNIKKYSQMDGVIAEKFSKYIQNGD